MSVALGDVDGDGDLDLVRGNYNQGATLYLDNGGTFATSPAWTGPVEATWSVALGDVDGDGDLDLVRGNRNQGATLYLNTGGTFSASPVWTGPVESTASVALGDVDGDGDLDLIRGNINQGATLYLNIGGTFSAIPDWTGPAETTYSVALGDVDLDGDLDLVCGNLGQGATLYLNVGGSFASTPVWRGRVESNTGVALGDVDGDGDLDLVCSNYNSGSTLYRNVGGTFATVPAWTGPAQPTASVVLGDVDADGDLDLIRGNYGEAATLYRNTGGTFGSSPAWTGPFETTYAVALADVDGDGDLDLVRGNDGTPATLYLNTNPPLAASPAWSGASGFTYCVALGDVDGDGDLDLVRGYDGPGATLTLNNDGTFAASNAWTGDPGLTYGVALGDLDNDGDPDLVRGNFGRLAVHYDQPMYYPGSFYPYFADWYGPSESTNGIALGDVDLDGYLDLVRGNSSQGSTLYLNRGYYSWAAPAWTGPPENTYSVALGDVDGDGDLDLVRGNNGQGSTLYRNVGGTFGSTPAWTGPVEATQSVALGDVDGDGDLDLVLGNDGQGATLHLNTGGTFASSAAWTGPGEATRSVVLADMDGDGDLDLIKGNNGQGATLYLNIGGTFTSTPVWTGPVEATYGVAVGDVDGDGDLDLVRGNYNQPATLYAGKTPWVRRGVPANLLPNNDAHLRWVHAIASGENLVTISFQAVDVESDPLWIVGEYQLKGSPAWSPLDLEGASPRAGPFSTSPAGVAHQVAWDVTRLPIDRRDVVIRLRAVSPPRRVGVIQALPSYLLDVGRIQPARPGMAVSTGNLVFPTVTVGDSAIAGLEISNVGNRALNIDRIESPDPEIQVQVQLPIFVSPGETRAVDVLLSPTRPFANPGPLRIHGNDPTRPVLDVPLATDIRQLEVTTDLVAALPELPLGEAASVIVTPAAGVRVERGFLFHRRHDPNAAFADSVALAPRGSTFLALIPGGSVTESGLDYYVRVENSGIFATDPPAAPGASFFYPVSAPVGITSAARPDPGGEFPTGRAIPIEVVLPQGSSFQSGRVYYRPGGAALEDSVDLALVELTPGVLAPSGTIPGTVAGARGVEYRVRVETLTRTLDDPPAGAGDRTHAVRTNVGNLDESASHAGGRYRMISVPLVLSLPATATLEALVSDDLGSYDPTRWRSYRYLPAEAGYREISAAAAADGALRPEPGRAFWLIARAAHQVDTAPVAGRSTPTDTTYRLPLGAGWNQVGNPFAFQVAWSSVRAEGTGGGAVTLEPPVAWDEVRGAYRPEDVTLLQPFEGYWVWNPTSGPVELSIPPDEAAAGGVVAAGSRERTVSRVARSSSGTMPGDSSAWGVVIAAVCGGARDEGNLAGVAAEGREGPDPLDRTEPPVAPGPALSLYFVQDAAAPGGVTARRTADIRSAIASGEAENARGRSWAFDVVRSGSGDLPPEVGLSFGGLERVPAEFEVRLVDRVLKRTIDLRQDPAYTLVGARAEAVAIASEARFELQVGTREYLAAVVSGLADRAGVTRLLPSFPNPVTGWGIVRFEMARGGRVRLELYDIAGRRVRRLVDEEREAGIHELVWRGESDDGRPVAAGIYSLRLVAPDRTDVRKLIKMR